MGTKERCIVMLLVGWVTEAASCKENKKSNKNNFLELMSTNMPRTNTNEAHTLLVQRQFGCGVFLKVFY
jgi:hypothetical protein